MNKRTYIERLLELLPDSYNDIFNKMYPKGLKKDQVSWATTQVENSVKELSRRVESKQKYIDDTDLELLELRMKCAALEANAIDYIAEINELTSKVRHLSEDPAAVETAEVAERLALLEALEEGGVDNWEWYEESIVNYENRNMR